MQRILHPVGQGAFYTEQFLIQNTSFEHSKLINVVLDCGSETTSLLENEIIRTFPRGSVVDMLFLSHFDRDHINGVDFLVDRCKLKTNLKPIRYLFLPLLNDQQKIIAWLETGIDKFGINDLLERFSAEKIIFVKPLEDSEIETRVTRREIPDNNETEEYEYRSIPLESIQNEIESGTGVRTNEVNNWIYVPFNAVDNEIYSKFSDFLKEKRKTEIWNKINNVGISYSLNEISERLDKSDWEEIKKVYKEFHEKVLKDKNSTSLLVYSGPSLFLLKKINSQNWKIDSEVSYLLDPRRVTNRLLPHFYQKTSGALYTGDINLSKLIKNKGSREETVFTRIYNILGPAAKYVGLIQVPHHGSLYNFNLQIIVNFPDAKDYFFSYGENNKYGHPWHGIKILLKAANKNIYNVTDNPDSEFFQIITIRN